MVIKILVGLLSDRLGLRLDCCPILNREVVHSAHGENRIVIVGSSHADRTGDALIRKGGFTVKKVIMPAWRAIKAKIPPMLEWLKTAMVDEPEDSLVVFQLLDSSLLPARMTVASPLQNAARTGFTTWKGSPHWPQKTSNMESFR